MTLPPDYNAAVAQQPRERALDLPPISIMLRLSDRRATASRCPACRPLPRRNAASDAAPPEVAPERTAVVAPIAYETPRPGARPSSRTAYRYGLERALGQAHLAFSGALDQKADRKPLTVGDKHQFRALALSGGTDASAPLFAGTKLPSRKASTQRSFSWLSSAASTARQRRSRVPSASQRRRRRQAVVAAMPYPSGRSCQRQPVRRTCKMASTVRRSSARGRPVFAGGGSCGAMNAHCRSVSWMRFFISPINSASPN